MYKCACHATQGSGEPAQHMYGCAERGAMSSRRHGVRPDIKTASPYRRQGSKRSQEEVR